MREPTLEELTQCTPEELALLRARPIVLYRKLDPQSADPMPAWKFGRWVAMGGLVEEEYHKSLWR